MNVSLAPACDADLEELITLRVEAMRDSLERVGRFDPFRAGCGHSQTRPRHHIHALPREPRLTPINQTRIDR